MDEWCSLATPSGQITPFWVGPTVPEQQKSGATEPSDNAVWQYCLDTA